MTRTFKAAATRLIAQWSAMDESERDATPSFGTPDYGPLPFTVQDDFSVVIGNCTNGIYSGGSDTDADALALEIESAADQVDYAQ